MARVRCAASSWTLSRYGSMFFRPFVELARHLDGEGPAVQQSVKGGLGDVVAARDARTSARLAHQFSHWMEKVDVVTSQVVDALEGCQRWPLQAVVADQTPHHGPVLLFDMTRVVLEVRPRAGER